ncbi:MAG: type II toxin-antitoxin system VapC family toxin [Planctomycetales bacterium]|nr:type II toxin-antitoxin system VapC family toxin [Planctomycetales bacterium]
MRLLLDTHAFLWFLANNPSLSSTALQAISNPQNDVFVSTVSAWEIAIKASSGKLTLARPFASIFPQQLALNNMDLLPIEVPHLAGLFALPSFHRDPFDRLLVAQAIVEGMTLVTSDAQLANYPLPVLW